MQVHHIAFRADATNQIGTGHFMRCLTLADGLRQRGAHIRFISRDLPVHLRNMLAAKDMEFVALDSNAGSSFTDELAHSHWLGTSQAQDAEATIQALSEQAWDWLIVDHYALDTRWESALRGTAKRIMVIDDIADRNHDCDILLDQNFYVDMQTRYVDKVPFHCRLLLGPRYALLRDEFRKLREQVKPRTGPVKRILVYFGGVDADNCTSQAINALAEMGTKGLHVDVVIGAQHPSRAEIEMNCAARGFVCHVQTDKMAELMAAADLTIGAGGSASWERCCLGLPALLVSLANNQVGISKALDLSGCCIYLGAFKKVNTSAIKHEITELLRAHNRLEMISRRAFSFADGMGVDRVYQELGF
jgi:UDP-2,4-diacetamido-2,4,6-trideoxy-beta-L-altropyranose hydrolase